LKGKTLSRDLPSGVAIDLCPIALSSGKDEGADCMIGLSSLRKVVAAGAIADCSLEKDIDI